VVTEERLQAVERRAQELERRMLRVEAAALDGQRVAPERPSVVAKRASVAEPVRPDRPSVAERPRQVPQRASVAEPVRPDRPAREVDLEQLLGGRVLAWVGGVAVLAGLALLFALAVSRGWIGEGARTAIGFSLSGGLVAVGVWLHGRRGRTEAARAAVGAGIAGLFMTVTVAANVYELVPAIAGLTLAFAVGALAAGVSIRWASRTIGALGIVGALLAPVLVGAPSDVATVAFVAVASLSALAVVMHQRWDWLALAVVVIGAPQWLWWLFDRAGLAGALAVLVGFGALYTVTALAGELRLPAQRLRTSTAFLLAIDALVLGIAGFEALDGLSGRTAAIAWLAALAAAHAVAGTVAERDRRISHEIALLCFTLAVLLADVGFAVATDGPIQTLGWAASAIGFAALVRRRGGADGVLAQFGLGGHVALAAVQACAQLDLGQLAGPGAELGAVGALATLAAGCLVSARLAADGHPNWRVVLDAGGLLALAGLGAVAAAALAGARMAPAGSRLRRHLVGASAGTLLYLASLAVVAWAPGASADALLLQGQLQLSALWAVAGIVALVVGLRLDMREVRLAALGLLGATAAKVFLYDLAALTSVYRVASFIGLGLVLLVAAFAYQRLRPEGLQDLRAMPDALR
jgi:uncharacterized membrane protein